MNEFYNKKKYFEEVEGISSQIYYHYTTLDALYNIVTQKTFRLTSLRTSNDKKELFYKPDYFLADFEAICSKEEDESIRKYFMLVKESIEQNSVEFSRGCRERVLPYALCLSEKRDNLTHWDRYASGCTGVCIGVNVAALEVYLRRMGSLAFGSGLYDVKKVMYAEVDRELYIRNGLISFFELLSEQEKERGGQPNWKEIIHSNAYVYAAAIFQQLARFSKMDSFVDEDEVRLYHDAGSIKSALRFIDLMQVSIGNDSCRDLKIQLEDVIKSWKLDKEQFCMTQRGIRGYKELCLEAIWGSGTVCEIILGPLCRQNRHELKRFLKANGLEGTEVVASTVPIR